SRDWSSDVCSSDLENCRYAGRQTPAIPRAFARLRPEKGYWSSRHDSNSTDLKHLGIAVIVENAAKSGQAANASDTAIPAQQNVQDVRPSDGASFSLRRSPETSLEDMMRATAGESRQSITRSRIRRAAPDFQSMSVGWRCTVIGMRSKGFHRRFIPSATDG